MSLKVFNTLHFTPSPGATSIPRLHLGGSGGRKVRRTWWFGVTPRGRHEKKDRLVDSLCFYLSFEPPVERNDVLWSVRRETD